MTEDASATGDLYAVLGVRSSASADEIRAAYRVLAHRFHPDHNPNSAEAQRRMQAINSAFAVLNSPEQRAAYDQTRAGTAAPPAPDARHGAGRGQRPYYRGKNWGLHTGADAPPEYIVRAEPSSFNLVVDALQEPPARVIAIHNDAPFRVRMAAVASPWLTVSSELLEVDAGAVAELVIGASLAAAAGQKGWRDGGVSLLTDDARVFCPDIRVTAIFLSREPRGAGSPPASQGAPDLRDVDGGSTESPRGGWRRLFGR